MNQELCSIPSEQEIWESVKAIPPDSALSEDGFTGHFYRECWETIKEDIMEMVQDFFQGDYLHQSITTTILILLPKTLKPKSLLEFRPISLASFAINFLLKILATRLARILPLVVDEQQYGFVKGRNIHESIALAQEMVTDIDRKTDGGNLIKKFDMSKEYDHLEWRFLLKALNTMGFSTTFQDLIYRLICNIWYRVNVNVFLREKFRSTRGVRQGDLVLPFLFILAQQIIILISVN